MDFLFGPGSIMPIIVFIVSLCWTAFSIYVMLAVLKIQASCEATLLFLKQAPWPGPMQVITYSPTATVPAGKIAPTTSTLRQCVGCGEYTNYVPVAGYLGVQCSVCGQR